MSRQYLSPDYDENLDGGPTDDIEDEGAIESEQDNLARGINPPKRTFKPTWGSPAPATNNSSPFGGTPPAWTGNSGYQWSSGQGTSPTWGNHGNAPSWGSQSPTFGGGYQPTRPSWGYSHQGSTFGGANSTNEQMIIPRQKKVIFCDVLGCLIEPIQSGGRINQTPRGIYDVRLKFEVWDKIACIGADRIYAMIPRTLIQSSTGVEGWKVMLSYVASALAEYLRLPYTDCQILAQATIRQPKSALMSTMIESIKVSKDDVVYIGLESGLSGQSSSDQFEAEDCGIDYIDLAQLTQLYR